MKVRIGDPAVKRIVKAAFPEYRGRRVSIETRTSLTLDEAFWGGGTRSWYVAVNLATLKSAPANAAITNPLRCPDAQTVDIPEGVAVVEHAHFCGKDVGIRIHVNPANVARLLPATVEG